MFYYFPVAVSKGVHLGTWSVVGLTPGRIYAVIYCQSPCLLVRHPTVIIRGRTGIPCSKIMIYISNKADKDFKHNQINKQINISKRYHLVFSFKCHSHHQQEFIQLAWPTILSKNGVSSFAFFLQLH